MVYIKEKLPSIFANSISKKIDNNDEYSYNKTEDRSIDDINKNKINIEPNISQKIKKVFSSTNYVYKADVKITTKDGVLTKKIVGRNNKSLITIDNEIIPIDSILDIELSK